MQNKKILRFVESFVLLPIITVSGSMGANLPQTGSSLISTSQFVLSQKLNIEAPGLSAYNQVMDQEAMEKIAKAEAVDAYFRAKGMPLVGTGMKMVEEAEKNNLDWRLVAAIAVRESTGGKYACKKAPNNPFGWNSCKTGFESNEHAIETIAKNLGGNNPNTAFYYQDKDVKGILRAYNPPSVVPRYAEQVMSIMNAIGTAEVVLAPDIVQNSQG